MTIFGRSFRLERIIAETWLPAPPTPKHRFVSRIDGDSSNYRADNLAWSTKPAAKPRKTFTTAEDREAIARFRESHPDWSLSAVAERFSVPVAYVSHISPAKSYLPRDRSSPTVNDATFTPPSSDEEEWRRIPNTEGFDVSSYGRVRSWRGLNPLIVRATAGKYPVVGINGIQRSVHSLVAQAFCPRSRPEQTVVNHKDRNPHNNVWSNLEWVTHQENAQHAWDTGSRKLGPNYGKRLTWPAQKEHDDIRSEVLASSAEVVAKNRGLDLRIVRGIARDMPWVNTDPSAYPDEEWRQACDSLVHEVSSYGRLRNKVTGRFLRQCPSSDKGYPTTGVLTSKGMKTTAVHTLVARAFLTRPPGKDLVDHINGDKEDNRVTNLRWFTYSENNKAAWDNGFNRGPSRRTEPVHNVVSAAFPTGDGEVWEPIPGHPGYFASTAGRFLSGWRPTPRILYPTTGRWSSAEVRLTSDRVPAVELLAKTFLGPAGEGQVPVPVDGDWSNMVPSNIQYRQREGVIQHPVEPRERQRSVTNKRTRTRSPRAENRLGNGSLSLNVPGVREVLIAALERRLSHEEAGRLLGVSQPAVSTALRRVSKYRHRANALHARQDLVLPPPRTWPDFVSSCDSFGGNGLSLSDLILSFLRLSGRTQQYVAEAMGVSASTVYQWSTGWSGTSDAKTDRLLAWLLSEADHAKAA